MNDDATFAYAGGFVEPEFLGNDEIIQGTIDLAFAKAHDEIRKRGFVVTGTMEVFRSWALASADQERPHYAERWAAEAEARTGRPYICVAVPCGPKPPPKPQVGVPGNGGMLTVDEDRVLAGRRYADVVVETDGKGGRTYVGLGRILSGPIIIAGPYRSGDYEDTPDDPDATVYLVGCESCDADGPRLYSETDPRDAPEVVAFLRDHRCNPEWDLR